MPARNLTTNQYRYGYQGQEVDPETGKPAFQLRLWDSRIGRWLTTDPYGQFDSPYLGMGNNPINGIDPDGGLFGRIRAWAHKLFNGGEIWKGSNDKWNWKKTELGEVSGSGEGDLHEIILNTKSFGYGGLGKLTQTNSKLSFKGQIDGGIVNIGADAGLVGYKIKMLTYELLSFDINKQSTNGKDVYRAPWNFDTYYINKNNVVRGSTVKATLEAGPYGDYSIYQKYSQTKNGKRKEYESEGGVVLGWTILSATINKMTWKGVHFKTAVHEDIGGGVFITGKLQLEASNSFHWEF